MATISGNIQLVINVDEALMYARKHLGNLQKRAPQAVRTALNKAAKEIKKTDEKTAKQTYNDPGDLNNLTMDKASAGNLKVILRDHGPAVPITHFKPWIGAMPKEGSGSPMVRAKINKNNGTKVIKHKNGKFAFFAGTVNGQKHSQRYRKKNVTHKYLRNGGAAVVARRGKARLPIDKINSLSSPSAHGSRDVWKVTEPEGKELLYKYLDEELGRILAG